MNKIKFLIALLITLQIGSAQIECPGNYFNNGDFEIGIPTNTSNNINLAQGWDKIWSGQSEADFYSSTSSAIGTPPHPISGNYGSLWIDNRLFSNPPVTTWREGMINELVQQIPLNSGTYTCSFDMACLSGFGVSEIGIYGVNATVPYVHALAPTNSHVPLNLNLYSNIPSQSIAWLGDIAIPSQCDGTKFSASFNFNTSSLITLNGPITHIIVTRSDDILNGSNYVGFDDFCIKKIPCECAEETVELLKGDTTYNLICNSHGAQDLILDCPASDISIGGFFGCIDSISGELCEETEVMWELSHDTNIIDSGVTSNYPIFLFSESQISNPGTYCLTRKTVCPGAQDTCVCKVRWIQTACDTCCTDLESFCQKLDDDLSVSIDNDSCKVKITLDSSICNYYLEEIIWGDSHSSGQLNPGEMAMHIYPGSGTYIISYLAIELDEDGLVCFEKFIKDTITIQCNGCPCDPNDLQSFSDDVDKGFATMTSQFNCTACFAPLALNDCDSVEWLINGLSPTPKLLSQGNQAICYDLQTSGTYQVTMIVTRYKPDGSICEIFQYSRNVAVNCNNNPSNCTAIIISNSGFGDGAVSGGLDVGGIGMSDGWTAASGKPMVVEGAEGSHDGWTIEITEDSSNIDVLTTIEPICPDIEINTLSLRFGIKEKGIKSSIAIAFYRGDDFEVSEPPIWNPIRCLRVATLDLEPYEEGVWYNMDIPLNISEWVALDTCSFRPALYIPCCASNPTSRTTIQIDEICSESTVSVKNLSDENLIVIFPNPTTAEFTVRFETEIPENGQIQIVDLLGQIIESETVVNGILDYKFSLETAQKGVYFIKITENGKPIRTKKIIKI